MIRGTVGSFELNRLKKYWTVLNKSYMVISIDSLRLRGCLKLIFSTPIGR